jgi:hypothetical protein
MFTKKRAAVSAIMFRKHGRVLLYLDITPQEMQYDRYRSSVARENRIRATTIFHCQHVAPRIFFWGNDHGDRIFGCI